MNTRTRARLRRHVVIASTVSLVLLIVSTADAVIRRAEEERASVVTPTPAPSPSPTPPQAQETVAQPKRVRVKRARAVRRRHRATRARRNVRVHRHHRRLTPKQRRGFLWPTHGIVTSPFGPRTSGFHHGMDIECRWGSVLRASKAGRVIYATKIPIYGRVVVLRHKKGFSTLYAHMYRLGAWGGQRIRRHQAIGRCGSSGFSTGPHVHFEIRRRGRWLNPRPFLR